MGIQIDSGITIGTGITIGEASGNAQPQFFNGDFSLGLTGWTTYNTQIFWSGGSTLAGWPTPVLPNPLPYAPNQKNWSSWDLEPAYSITINADRPSGSTGQSSDLNQGTDIQGGIIDPAGGTAYGPALSSDTTVLIVAGDSVSFAWRGLSTSDAYSIYAYLVNVNTGATVSLLRAVQASVVSTAWATVTTVINTSGEYQFVFVAGCWDSTLGTVVGAQFRLTDVRRIPQ
jgi:trimeric autotransporter adhesin